MSDYLLALFQYAQEARLGPLLREDQDYRDTLHQAEQADAALRTMLPPQGVSLLESLRDLDSHCSIQEQKALFRLGFSAASDLLRL